MSDIESISDRTSGPSTCQMYLRRLMDPSSAVHRYVALFFICVLGFGNNFCYDTPGALEVPIEDAMSVGTSQFTSLYALYSWPNIIMSFFGGLLIDKVLGIRLGAVVFLILLLVGQYLFALGAFTGHFWLMQLGRLVYGLGGESLAVAQNTYVVTWFKGRELNTVFGFQMTVSRGGSTLAFNTMHPLYTSARQHYSPQTALGYTLAIAGLTCVLSFLISIILGLQDKRAERILHRPSLQSNENISIKDAVDFKSNFWILSVVCVCFYVTVFPFVALGSKFLQKKWGYDPVTSDAIDSLVYILSAVLSPIIGFIVDKTGRNLMFLLIAGILVMTSHTLMALTFMNIWIPMITLGVGYSVMCSALWPLVALAVPQNQLGTAYGVMQAIQNLGLALASNLTGLLVDSKGYTIMELFFVLLVSISVIFTIIMIVQDSTTGGLLNKSAKARRQLELLEN